MFNYNGNIQPIKDAISLAHKRDLLNHVVNEIKRSDNFDLCNCEPEKLARGFDQIFKTQNTKVVVYYPAWRWSKAKGYYNSSTPKIIYINGYWANKSTPESICSLLYHELGHKQMSYTACNCHHGSNSPNGKGRTYQYSINKYVNSFFGVNSYTYAPWWKRLFNWIF